jgi:DNA-binding Lrp family transcriptional regulator
MAAILFAMTENESERDEQGQFAERTSDDDILREIRESEFPAVTARWVADTVGMERRPVHQRLDELHERGELKRGKLSPRVVIWWLPEKE